MSFLQKSAGGIIDVARIFAAGRHSLCGVMLMFGVLNGVESGEGPKEIVEFFHLEMALSNAFMAHKACTAGC